MAAGNVTVEDDGEVSASTGAAGRLFVVLRASVDASRADFDLPPLADTEDDAPVLKSLAGQANAFASWLVAELTAQTTALVSTSTTGLQRMPASTAENTDTKAPSANKSLALVHVT